MVKILLNTKPFGKFIVSQEAFLRIIQKDYLNLEDGKSQIVSTLSLDLFNRLHGLDWSSPDIFFTEKQWGYKTHSVLPVFLKKNTVYYFQDSVKKNGLTISRHHPIAVETFEELKENFNSSSLEAKIFSVPFVKDLAIGVDREGSEYYYYFQ